jgi:sugar lactone lactonase YvrE
VWITTSGVLYFVDKGTRKIRRVILGIITTVIGSGNTGYSGENTAALGTSMTNPFSMYVDSNGNIFYTDYAQHRVRQYSPFTNTVWTIAGTGSVGFLGDGDFATLARLNSPAGIFGDTNGNIYIADQGNYRIRKVTANNGSINTIAGSGGVSCTAGDHINALIISICQPAGLFLDTLGNLYYSDFNNRIRLIYSTSNIVVNIAGNGNNGYVQDGVLANMTKINSASEIWADSNGVLYIGDFGNHRVRRVNLDKTITTFAGDGLYSSYGDGGPASLAQLNSPKGIFLSTNGVLYIADTSNCKVRAVMISSSNIIGTYGGTGACGGDPSTKPVSLLTMNLPVAIWGDKYGNFYVTENNWIRKVDASNQATVWIGTGGCCYNGENETGTSVVLGSPQGIWGTTDGASLFVAEGLGHRIRKVDLVARTAITFAGTGSVGAPTENIAATLSDMNTPYSVWVDSIGVVYFAEFTNNVIRKVVYNAVLGISEVRTIAGNQLATYNGNRLAATMTAVNRPTFVTGDSSGRIYFVDSNNKLVRVIQAVNSSFTEVATVIGKYAGNTATGLQLATDSGLNTPLSAVVDTNGDIYVVEGTAGFI